MSCCSVPFGFGAAILNTVVQTIAQGVAGQPTTLQIGVANIGTNSATITSWVVQLSPGLAGVTFPKLPPGASASYDNGTGVVTVTNFPTTLAPGALVCFEITFTQPATGTVTYTVQPVPGAAATNGVSTPPPQVDAAVSMAQSAGSVLVGASHTITATISNLGPDDGDGANVIPTFPSGFTVTSATWANGSPGVIGGAVLPNGTASILTFPPGGSIQRVWVGTYSTASAGAVFAAAVQVPVSVADPVGANDAAQVTTVVNASADLQVSYSAAATVAPGAPAPQTVTITNNGPSAVSAAPVTFSIPANFVASGATWTGATGGATAGSGSALSYTTGIMPSGSTIVLTLQGTHTANAATTAYSVTIAPPAGTVDGVSGNNTSTVNVTVTAAAWHDAIVNAQTWYEFNAPAAANNYSDLIGAPGTAPNSVPHSNNAGTDQRNKHLTWSMVLWIPLAGGGWMVVIHTGKGHDDGNVQGFTVFLFDAQGRPLGEWRQNYNPTPVFNQPRNTTSSVDYQVGQHEYFNLIFDPATGEFGSLGLSATANASNNYADVVGWLADATGIRAAAYAPALPYAPQPNSPRGVSATGMIYHAQRGTTDVYRRQGLSGADTLWSTSFFFPTNATWLCITGGTVYAFSGGGGSTVLTIWSKAESAAAGTTWNSLAITGSGAASLNAHPGTWSPQFDPVSNKVVLLSPYSFNYWTVSLTTGDCVAHTIAGAAASLADGDVSEGRPANLASGPVYQIGPQLIERAGGKALLRVMNANNLQTHFAANILSAL